MEDAAIDDAAVDDTAVNDEDDVECHGRRGRIYDMAVNDEAVVDAMDGEAKYIMWWP